MATTKRPGLSYVWASHITRLLCGEAQCLYAPWLKANFQFEKLDSNFNFAAWKVEHQDLLQKTAIKFATQWGKPQVEDQNEFKLTGTSAILAGKPDLVFRRDKDALVVDAKTGTPRDSDGIQVALYMIVLPLVWKEPVTMHGAIAYKHQTVDVPLESVAPIRPKLFELMRRLGSDVRPEPTPTEAECGWCSISAIDCDRRFGEGKAVDVMTSEW